VHALSWLPNDDGFLSGGMDRKVIIWVRSFPGFIGISEVQLAIQNKDGTIRDSLSLSLRIADLAVTPDLSRVVVVGLESVKEEVMANRAGEQQQQIPPRIEHKMVVYDLQDKREEL
jgi:WD repeat-containing protein 26